MKTKTQNPFRPTTFDYCLCPKCGRGHRCGDIIDLPDSFAAPLRHEPCPVCDDRPIDLRCLEPYAMRDAVKVGLVLLGWFLAAAFTALIGFAR